MKRGRPPGAVNTQRPCTSAKTTQHSSFLLHHTPIIPIPPPFCKGG